MTPHFLWLLRALGIVSIVAVFCSSSAHAQSGGQVMNPGVVNVFTTTGGAKIYTGPGVNPLTGRLWANGAGGAVVVTETAAGLGPGMAGGSITATLGRVITPVNLLRAAMVYGTWDQAVGFGDAINGWLGQSRCVPLRFGETEQSLCDPGALPTTKPAPGGSFCTGFVSGQGDIELDCSVGGAQMLYAAQGGSMRDLGAWVFANQTSTGYTAQAPRYCENCSHIPANQDGFTGRTLAKRSCPAGTGWNAMAGTCSAKNTTSCPAITDPYYVGWNQTADSLPGPDGKCRTGSYMPNPYADAAAKINANGDPTKAKDAAKDLVDNKGGKIDADAGSLTGPATKTGAPQVTQKNNPDGSKDVTTKTPTYNYTYGPTTVTITNNYTTTVNHTNPDGSAGGTSTETGTDPVEKPEDVQPTDTAMPEVPTLYVKKFPEGIKGAWNAKMAEIKALPIFGLPTKLMPNIQDGGSCPAWPIPLDFGNWANFGTHDVSPPCWTWNFGAIIIVLSALLLARALIFGG